MNISGLPLGRYSRAQQWEALDLLAELAEELCHEMQFELGDIQFINNHVVYRARSAFEDDATSGQQRLLYRVWLSMANSRPLPESYGILFGSTAASALRDGIAQVRAHRQRIGLNATRWSIRCSAAGRIYGLRRVEWSVNVTQLLRSVLGKH